MTKDIRGGLSIALDEDYNGLIKTILETWKYHVKTHHNVLHQTIFRNIGIKCFYHDLVIKHYENKEVVKMVFMINVSKNKEIWVAIQNIERTLRSKPFWSFQWFQDGLGQKHDKDILPQCSEKCFWKNHSNGLSHGFTMFSKYFC